MYSSSSSNISTYSCNPFDKISSQKKSELNSYNNYEISGFFEDNKTNQKPEDFTVTINVEYKKALNKVIINEVISDNQGNKIEQTFNISNENPNRAIVSKFLQEVKSKFESEYKREEKIEIELEFIFENWRNDAHIIKCLYNIKSNVTLEESAFKDEDILNKKDYLGLDCMVNVLNG